MNSDDGALLVRNGSPLDPGNHKYQVTVTDGIPIHCGSPAEKAYDGACRPRVAVAIRTPILEAAVHTQLAADGSGLSKQPLSEEQYLTEKYTRYSTGVSDGPIDSDESSCDHPDEEEEYPCECDDGGRVTSGQPFGIAHMSDVVLRVERLHF